MMMMMMLVHFKSLSFTVHCVEREEMTGDLVTTMRTETCWRFVIWFVPSIWIVRVHSTKSQSVTSNNNQKFNNFIEFFSCSSTITTAVYSLFLSHHHHHRRLFHCHRFMPIWVSLDFGFRLSLLSRRISQLHPSHSFSLLLIIIIGLVTHRRYTTIAIALRTLTFLLFA